MSYKGEGTTDQGLQEWDASVPTWRGRPRPGAAIQTISGSGVWNGTSDVILVSGAGARTINLASVGKAPTTLTIIDIDGTANAGNISIAGGSATINGAASVDITENFGSYTLITNETGAAGAWVSVSQTPEGGGVEDHGALTGLGDDDHTQYLLVDGTRATSGDFRIGDTNIPSSGYLRVSRRGQTTFDILTTTLNDNTTLRQLISASTDNFRLHTSASSPLVVLSDAQDSPLRFTSGGNSVDAGLRGASHNTFAIFSANAASVSTHQYGPTATAGNALNLSYRSTPTTTVMGLGVINATDTTKLLVQGLNNDGSTFIYRGTNSLASTVFSVDDLGRTTVGFASTGNHAVHRDFVTWVESTSAANTTLGSLGPGRTNLHLADVSGGAHTVDLDAAPVQGDRVIIKDHQGAASSFTLTVDGNGNNIDGQATQDITTDYGSLSLYFDGNNWVVV